MFSVQLAAHNIEMLAYRYADARSYGYGTWYLGTTSILIMFSEQLAAHNVEIIAYVCARMLQHLLVPVICPQIIILVVALCSDCVFCAACRAQC